MRRRLPGVARTWRALAKVEIPANLQQYIRTTAAPIPVAVLIVLFGGGLRLYHYNTLSLWLDEGFTVYFSRLPWATVIGLRGSYDVHPPLYYSVVKLASAVVPEIDAGRLVSVVAGTLTIAVLYCLVSRLLSSWAGVLAALILAVSPLHVWYSQEARQYAATVFAVAASYLALVAFFQTRRLGWAIAYTLSLASAMYLDYSALFSLAPQIVILAYMITIDKRCVPGLFGALTGSVLLYLPWMRHLLQSQAATSLLGFYPEKLWNGLLSLIGLAGNTYYANGSYFIGSSPAPWDRWPDARIVFVLVVLPAVVVGSMVLVERSTTALLVAAGLLVGTIGFAGLVSLHVAPSFAPRTILYTTLGWGLLVGAVALRVQSSDLLSLAGRVSVLLIVALSLLTLQATYQGAQKQRWRDVAADVARASRFGWPVVTYPTVMPTLIDMYQKHVLDGRNIPIPDMGSFPALTSHGKRMPDALWFAYLPSNGYQHPHEQLAALHYERIFTTLEWSTTFLDLYSRPGQRLGKEVWINGHFRSQGNHVIGWHTGTGVVFHADPGHGRDVILTNRTVVPIQVATVLHIVPANLHVLSLQEKILSRTGKGLALLLCMSSSGAILQDIATAPIPADNKWHAARIAAWCPLETRTLKIAIENVTQGTIAFRDVSLQEARPH